MRGARLPIDRVLPELRRTLAERHEAVLEAPPGAGKTTRVPLTLLKEPWLGGSTILMLEPRRLAARAAAEYMAGQLGEPVGRTVGYRMRLESRVGPATRILVITEGVLTRVLQDDPCLEGVGLVIFDEYHERSLDADLGLALTLQGRELFRDRDPLKVLVMSATLETAGISDLLGHAPVIRGRGRQYPVEVLYGEPWRPDQDTLKRVRDLVLKALSEQSGSILVFLPGQAEIRHLNTALSDRLEGYAGIQLAPLYGDLDIQQQRRAIAPAPAGTRKVVLATSIAETSLTIDGVRVVVDSGLSRQPVFDPPSGMTRLQTRRLSQAASTQRMGRAGRVEPGVCYRLWSELQQSQLEPHSPPEIRQADLAPLALNLLAWGVTDPGELAWLDPPPNAAYAQALDLLRRLGAATSDRPGHWHLTGHGKQLAALPVHPRLGHLLLVGRRHGLLARAADLATLLSERDPLPREGTDIEARLEWLSGDSRSGRPSPTPAQRLLRQSRRFRELCRGTPTEPVDDPTDPRLTGFLVASAYPERIAQRRGSGGEGYRLSNRRGARLPPHDPLQRYRWLAVAHLGGRQGEADDRIFLASPLDPVLFEGPLKDQVRTRERVQWDPRAGRLLAERQERVGALTLSHRPLQRVPPETRRRAALQLVREKGLGLLPWTPELRQWQARVRLLHALSGGEDEANPWPDVSDTRLLATLADWLGPHLGSIGHLDHLADLNLNTILQGLLPWPLHRQLETQAPSRFRVPSGSLIPIDYREDPPVLAVRLQEMFGCAETPRLAGGRVPLKLHLLSPARRPLQVTQDLGGFWKGAYHQVRREMRGRYPKHPWPEDPLTATATRHAKARGKRE